MVDLGEGSRVPGLPLILSKKEKITEGKKAGRASKMKLPSLTLGLDLPLIKTPAVCLARLNTLRGTKYVSSNPKRYYEHHRFFSMKVSPGKIAWWRLISALVRNYCCNHSNLNKIKSCC